MVLTLSLSFVAGLFGGNALPHFLRGITHERYPTVLGHSPTINFLAGWVGLLITAVLVAFADVTSAPRLAGLALAAGVLVSGLFHAAHGAIGREP
jgi:hypothetical protein